MNLSTELIAHFARTGAPPEDFLDQCNEVRRTIEALKHRMDALIEELWRGD